MYHGDSFYIREFKAWMETQPKGAELKLKCTNPEKVRSRVNYYCRSHGHTVTTTKKTDSILTLKLIWI